MDGFGSWRHLATRFFGALSTEPPAPVDEAWAVGCLCDGEQALWHRMSAPDRRHAIGVARDTLALLETDDSHRDIVAAALLHDVGKVESGFGTFSRVGVTLAARAVGRERLIRWCGPTSRTALYLTHDQVGAQLLETAGSEKLTVAWTAEHHLAPERWSVDAAVGAALKAADGD